MLAVLGAAALIVSLVALVAELRFVARAKRAYASVERIDRDRWTEVEGRRVGLHAVERENSHAILSFTADNGRVVEIEVAGEGRNRTPVLYLPDDPGHAQTEDVLTMWGFPSLAGFVGLLLVAAALRVRRSR